MKLINKDTGKVYQIESIERRENGQVKTIVARHKQDRLIIFLETLSNYIQFKRDYQLKGIQIRQN